MFSDQTQNFLTSRFHLKSAIISFNPFIQKNNNQSLLCYVPTQSTSKIRLYENILIGYLK